MPAQDSRIRIKRVDNVTQVEFLDRFETERKRIRLTGVAAQKLVPIEETRTLFPDEKKEKDKKLEAVSAALRDRFGGDPIKRAALLERTGSLRETQSHGGPHEKPERPRR